MKRQGDCLYVLGMEGGLQSSLTYCGDGFGSSYEAREVGMESCSLHGFCTIDGPRDLAGPGSG